LDINRGWILPLAGKRIVSLCNPHQFRPRCKNDGVQANIACPPEAKSDCEGALANFGIGLIMVDAEF